MGRSKKRAKNKERQKRNERKLRHAPVGQKMHIDPEKQK